MRSLCLFLLLVLGNFSPAMAQKTTHRSTTQRPISFNRDIRPILAAKCFACHGRDEEHREAKLRLDVREQAVESGAIVAEKPDESELIQRIFSEDEDERMPPTDEGDPLSAKERELFRRWISEGAIYEKHWAFIRPVKPPLPEVANPAWPRNGIDHFVLARLESEKLQPSDEADRYALVRRVYLDLIGLPPTVEEADIFVHSNDPQAYELLVDRLLKSDRYGERWAREWLDLARYADTNGYEKDRERSIWPYRDWVIRAINQDMPFDRFTIEQLAGDMLPNAGESQAVATGFHRNTMLNEEGGIDPLEYRFYAMVDRVATTATVWLGLTTGCAQCHTHKYDPITHTDYYQFLGLMNNADEPDRVLKTPDVQQRRKVLLEQIHQLESELPSKFSPADGGEPTEDERRNHLEEKFAQWLAHAQSESVEWKSVRPSQMKTNLPRLEILDDDSIFSSGDITKRDEFVLDFAITEDSLPITALRLEVLPDERLPQGGPGRAFYEGRKGDFFLSELTASLNADSLAFVAPSRSYGKIAIGSGSADAENVLDGDGSTGWSTAQREGEPHQLVLNLDKPIASAGKLQIKLLFERHFAASLGRFRFSFCNSSEQVAATEMPVDIETLVAKKLSKTDQTDGDRERLLQYYLRVAPELAEARKPIDKLRGQLPAFPTTMVLTERPRDNIRKTFRQHRGEFLSPREEVTPGLPSIFAESSKAAPTDRLALAHWLVSEENPLVARVTVNRAWQAFFGTGLLETPGDFGTQADLPSHPELLDWLAMQFVENQWSMKSLHRLIVTSATYRQDSKSTAALRHRDPANRLLARGPRLRVSAETVRDIMLHSSGLLSEKMYGPSVHPPQPSSVASLAYGNFQWKPSQGEDRYRRSLYTFSKRTAPFAAYTIFDGPTGETCTARRDRSNTPLQALTLLNDEMYLEMSRASAGIALVVDASDTEIATAIFRRLVIRPPTENETVAILQFQRRQLERLQENELDASKIAGRPPAKEPTTDADTLARAASWSMVARALMNLDEAITKP